MKACRKSCRRRTARSPSRELIAKAKRPIAVIGSSAMRIGSRAASPGDRAPQSAVRHDDHGQGHDRRGSSAVDQLHRALVPADSAQAPAQRRSHRRPRLRTVEVEYEAWIGEDPLLQVDIEPVDIAPSVKLAHQVTGDLDASLTRLAALPAGTNAWTPAVIPRIARPSRLRTADERHIHRARRNRRGAAALPRDGLLSFDVGAHTHQIASQWTAHAPKTFHITNGWSSMGFGLPGAIAASSPAGTAGGLPDRRRLLPDDLRRGRGGEAHGARGADRRARRQMAGADQGEADPRQFPLYGTELQAEEYTEPPQHYFGVPAIGVRSSDALEECGEEGAGGERPDGD